MKFPPAAIDQKTSILIRYVMLFFHVFSNFQNSQLLRGLPNLYQKHITPLSENFNKKHPQETIHPTIHAACASKSLKTTTALAPEASAELTAWAQLCTWEPKNFQVGWDLSGFDLPVSGFDLPGTWDQTPWTFDSGIGHCILMLNSGLAKCLCHLVGLWRTDSNMWMLIHLLHYFSCFHIP